MPQGRRAMNLPVDSLNADIVGNASGLWVGLAIYAVLAASAPQLIRACRERAGVVHFVDELREFAQTGVLLGDDEHVDRA